MQNIISAILLSIVLLSSNILFSQGQLVTGGQSESNGTWTIDYSIGQLITEIEYSDDFSVSHGLQSIVSLEYSTLPVEFLVFYGINKEDYNLLLWSTASESNNESFTIEVSRDNFEWEEIGTVIGSGNSNIIREYEIRDYLNVSELSYYRIKQTDYDGAYSYSKTIVISPKSNTDIIYFPNPTSGKFTILVNDEVDFISIKNNIGLQISRNSYSYSEESNIIKFDIDNLSSGIYFVEIIMLKNEEVEIIKIVKI